MKYIELVKGVFTADHEARAKQVDPYVAYSAEAGKLMFSIVPEENQIEYQLVDLGLPSGLKWADRNVGAETPQDNGLYFSWGNVDGHAVDENGNTTDGYSFNSNKYDTTSGGLYKKSTLDAEHDAATVNMGEEWRMPTKAEIVELFQNTDHYYIGEDGSIVAGPFDYKTNSSDKGLDGSPLRSICFVKKDETFDYNNRINFIEFPFTGSCSMSLVEFKGVSSFVWTSQHYEYDSSRSCSLGFYNSGLIHSTNSPRVSGKSVRGVHA